MAHFLFHFSIVSYCHDCVTLLFTANRTSCIIRCNIMNRIKFFTRSTIRSVHQLARSVSITKLYFILFMHSILPLKCQFLNRRLRFQAIKSHLNLILKFIRKFTGPVMKRFLLLSTTLCVVLTLLTGFLDLRNAGSRSLLLVHFVRTACLVLGRTAAQTRVTWDWLSGSDKRYLCFFFLFASQI